MTQNGLLGADDCRLLAPSLQAVHLGTHLANLAARNHSCKFAKIVRIHAMTKSSTTGKGRAGHSARLCWMTAWPAAFAIAGHTWSINDQQTGQAQVEVTALPQTLCPGLQSRVWNVCGSNLLRDSAGLPILHICPANVVQNLGLACSTDDKLQCRKTNGP